MIFRNIAIGLLFGLIAYSASVYAGVKLNGSINGLIQAYHNSMRGYFFSAFLGISSFLLSLLTFVVINLKEKMFDSEDYKRMYAKFNGISDDSTIVKRDLYKPLVVITTLLVFSIVCCLATSLLQFTLGFSNCKWVLVAPTIIPFIAISFMSLSLYQMTQLIYQWLRSEDVIKVS